MTLKRKCDLAAFAKAVWKMHLMIAGKDVKLAKVGGMEYLRREWKAGQMLSQECIFCMNEVRWRADFEERRRAAA